MQERKLFFRIRKSGSIWLLFWMWEYDQVSVVFCIKLIGRLFSHILILNIGLFVYTILHISEVPSSRVQEWKT